MDDPVVSLKKKIKILTVEAYIMLTQFVPN